MVSQSQVVDQIRRIVQTELTLEGGPRELKESDRLIEDLGLDSVALTSLAVALEDHFRVILTGAPPEELSTIGGLATYVAARAETPAEGNAP